MKPWHGRGSQSASSATDPPVSPPPPHTSPCTVASHHGILSPGSRESPPDGAEPPSSPGTPPLLRMPAWQPACRTRLGRRRGERFRSMMSSRRTNSRRRFRFQLCVRRGKEGGKLFTRSPLIRRSFAKNGRFGPCSRGGHERTTSICVHVRIVSNMRAGWPPRVHLGADVGTTPFFFRMTAPTALIRFFPPRERTAPQSR